MLLIVHYLAADLASWAVLMEDLQTLYVGREIGPPPPSFARRARGHARQEGVLAAVPPQADDTMAETVMLRRLIPDGVRIRRDTLVAALARALAAQTGSRIAFHLEERETADQIPGAAVGCLSVPHLVVVDVAASGTGWRVQAGTAEPYSRTAGSDMILRLRPPARGWRVLPGLGPERAAANPRPYRAEITCAHQADGSLEISFDADFDITALADAMVGEVRELLDASARYTPTDFPDAGISADALDRAILRLRSSR